MALGPATAFRKITEAKTPEEIFGKIELAGIDARLAVLASLFRRIARVVHPDQNENSDESTKATAALVTFRDEAECRIRAEVYGQKVVTPKATRAPEAPVVLTIKGKQFVLEGVPAFTGDLCDVFRAHAEDGPSLLAAKVCRDQRNNDLVENEARMIKLVSEATLDKHPKLVAYLPTLVTSAKLAGAQVRQVNVIPWCEDCYSIAEVKAAYPEGIKMEAAIWMFKRILVALGLAHRAGVVHGAVLPAHVLINPELHAARLVDWSYAVEIGKGHVKAISVTEERLYAPEILSKGTPRPATDIYMAAKTILDVLDPAAPAYFRQFLKGCSMQPTASRMIDAWDLHADLDSVLLRQYGKPKFHPFTMPKRTT